MTDGRDHDGINIISKLQKYVRRDKTPVTAVKLDLDTEGFTYKKWGGVQRATEGDWLVNNDGDTYTVDREIFEQTYRAQSPGVYVKVKPVWARMAESNGNIQTKEGVTNYNTGDMIVFNDVHEKDGYAMKPETFSKLYKVA